jgi:hypothetical protein
VCRGTLVWREGSAGILEEGQKDVRKTE